MRIVVDAMGGDHAPTVVVEGAVSAARELGVSCVLVGPAERVEPLLVEVAGGSRERSRLAVEVEHAPEVVGMDEMPLQGIRRKKRSSILVGLRMVRDGRGDAFVSAGNTGAIMAAATIVLRRLSAVDRPALAAILPTPAGNVVLLDVGANVTVRAEHLEQFAVMGSCFHRAVTAEERPRVALLSIGEEEIKGNDLIRQVHRDLKEGPVNFIGNVDGKDVYSGHAQVIVTDGFTGNAVLKASESLLKALLSAVRTEVEKSLAARLGALLMKPTLMRLGARLDHAEYGAVPLLGVSEPVFIGHGSSSAKSIRSAIRVAATFVEQNVNDAIEAGLRSLAEAVPGDGESPASAPEAGARLHSRDDARHLASGGEK